MQMKHRMYFGFVEHSEFNKYNLCTKRLQRDEVSTLLCSKSSSFLSDICGSLSVNTRMQAKGNKITKGTQNLYVSVRFRVSSKIVIIMNSASINPYLNSVFAVPRDSLLT